jgi:hypothetical protein
LEGYSCRNLDWTSDGTGAQSGGVDRPNRLVGASVARLVEWQSRTFPTMRPRPTPFLDELPEDLFVEPAATWAAIERAQRG